MTPQKSMSKMFKLMRSKFGNIKVDVSILEEMANVEMMFPMTPNKLRTVVITPLSVDNHAGIRLGVDEEKSNVVVINCEDDSVVSVVEIAVVEVSSKDVVVLDVVVNVVELAEVVVVLVIDVVEL